jgi:hypothetical protein
MQSQRNFPVSDDAQGSRPPSEDQVRVVSWKVDLDGDDDDDDDNGLSRPVRRPSSLPVRAPLPA